MHGLRDSGEKRTSLSGFDILLQEIRGAFYCDDDGGSRTIIEGHAV